MTIDSLGYPGSIMPALEWSTMQLGLGAKYWVQYSGAAKVTPVFAGTRQVSVSAGRFGGVGIVDNSNAAVTLTLPTVSSGTTYFLIVARRHWGPTSEDCFTEFAYIDSGSNKTTITPDRHTDAGVDMDDQPLALVSVTFGQTVPVIVEDLRPIKEYGTGVMQAFSEMVMQYMDLIGMQILINGNLWTCRYSTTSSSRSWDKDPGRTGSINLTPITPVGSASGTGFIAGEFSPDGNYMVRDGNTIHLYLLLRRNAATITPGSGSGDVTNFVCCKITNGITPEVATPWAGYYWSSGKICGCQGYVDPNGDVYVVSLTAGRPMTKQDTVGSPSLRVYATFPVTSAT